MRTPARQRLPGSAGFSLVELAIVLLVVTLMLSSLLYTLSAQTEQRNFEDTRRRLEQARELVLAFAIVNGRLPCPATAASGFEDPVGGGSCTTPYGGWLPARTIGFQITDPDGFAIDAWTNRIRYAVSATVPINSDAPRICRPLVNPAPPPSFLPPVAPHFTDRNNMKLQGIDCQPSDLLICKSATGITGTACGGGANQIMSQNLVAAVIFSTGKNTTTTGGTGVDEAANLNGDQIFVFHPPAPSGAANGEFDDQFTWITVGELYGRMIAGGMLP